MLRCIAPRGLHEMFADLAGGSSSKRTKEWFGSLTTTSTSTFRPPGGPSKRYNSRPGAQAYARSLAEEAGETNRRPTERKTEVTPSRSGASWYEAQACCCSRSQVNAEVPRSRSPAAIAIGFFDEATPSVR